MSGRSRLPNRRLAETFELEVAGLRYTATIGRFPDGRVGEIFLNNHKSNSAADTNARDSAIVCSIALQCGADIETIRKALTRDAQGGHSRTVRNSARKTDLHRSKSMEGALIIETAITDNAPPYKQPWPPAGLGDGWHAVDKFSTRQRTFWRRFRLERADVTRRA
jgi:hypothetical protein